ncbi:hypothetical protein, variant 3 [Aphanomyces invadans]|uniref:Uncharacterized protein n=1 Tax=Aphanomyces invadans TaxID=157072 RepID=A0A024U502_9STRA|nr:hypothetical protein, variant 2 [Aphanomyces invadans]XP_008869946.1 hypothetical protein, variant 3 [Aphanomyces invadans]ETW00947.1 hypothetical protein, variant 2 [Aphanomyces invadans]ETW00948.1 hypothetical protein, variant 3 [Aphanomyces invadans]|eukprot:XP_008869945.1 hypothetical protein, variant 2 [Aphanomyces invadans]
MDTLDCCVAQMRACADKLRSTKNALSLTYLDMKARDLPAITITSRLVFEEEEKEDDIVEKHKRRYEACVKQAEEQVEKLMAEKKQLEQDLRRQSQQFRQVLEERDADVQVEYAKMIAELNDHIEDSKQQLNAAVESRDAKQSLVRNLPSPSLASQADLHKHRMLQQQIMGLSKEVSELQAELHQIEEELSRPVAIKRKANALDEADSSHHVSVAQECNDIQVEIAMLIETEQALQDQATQRRLHAAQQEENQLALREVEEVGACDLR